jgi:hypothetical protein
MVTPAEPKGLDEREDETKKSARQAGVVECRGGVIAEALRCAALG